MAENQEGPGRKRRSGEEINLDPTLVSQLKDTLPDRLFEKLNGSLSIDQDRLKFV
jgi:hypothetical protein